MFTGNNIILFIFVVLSILIGVIANWITAATTIMSGGFPARYDLFLEDPLYFLLYSTDLLFWWGITFSIFQGYRLILHHPQKKLLLFCAFILWLIVTLLSMKYYWDCWGDWVCNNGFPLPFQISGLDDGGWNRYSILTLSVDTLFWASCMIWIFGMVITVWNCWKRRA